MNQFYVVCELGLDAGRVMMGTLHDGRLDISEIRRFQNVPVVEKDVVQWNIPELYQEILEGFRTIAAYEEPVAGVSSVSCPGAYLLVNEEGALMTPTYHHTDPHVEAATQQLLSNPACQTIYDETGTQPLGSSMLFQAAAETPKRLKHARHILPLADGFNYLLSGVPAVEVSMAGATQLYSPVESRWSERLLELAGLPLKLLPLVVPGGTILGHLRKEVTDTDAWEDTKVIAACSLDTAAALTGLPVRAGEEWAFLIPDSWTIMGGPVPQPLITEATRELQFDNQLGYQGSVCLYKRTNGLRILEACLNDWDQKNRGFDPDLLSHLAGSATPFESLIDPADPRFLSTADMPARIHAYCKETDQPVPRKPGPIYRCILESLALLYRKILQETQYLTAADAQRLYVLRGQGKSLLNHFTSNALGLPVIVASPNAAVIGNMVVQALALGHIQSLDEARHMVRQSLRMETMLPHASIWDTAYDRFVSLAPAPVTA